MVDKKETVDFTLVVVRVRETRTKSEYDDDEESPVGLFLLRASSLFLILERNHFCLSSPQ